MDDTVPIEVVMVNAVKIKEVFVPAKRHTKRRWMSEVYHQRIQKKWDRRFSATKTVADGSPLVMQISRTLFDKLTARRLTSKPQ